MIGRTGLDVLTVEAEKAWILSVGSAGREPERTPLPRTWSTACLRLGEVWPRSSI